MNYDFNSQNIDKQIKQVETNIQKQQKELKRLHAIKQANVLSNFAGILIVDITDYLITIHVEKIECGSTKIDSNIIKYNCPYQHSMSIWHHGRVEHSFAQNPPKWNREIIFPRITVRGSIGSYAIMVSFLDETELTDWEHKIAMFPKMEPFVIERCVQKFIQSYEIPNVIKTLLKSVDQKLDKRHVFDQSTKNTILYTLHVLCKAAEGFQNPDTDLGKICAKCLKRYRTDGTFDFDTDEFAGKLKKYERDQQKLIKQEKEGKEAAKEEDEEEVELEPVSPFSQKEGDEIIDGFDKARRHEVSPLITKEQQDQLESMFEQDIKDFDEEQLDMIEDSPEKEQLAREAQESRHDRVTKLVGALEATENDTED